MSDFRFLADGRKRALQGLGPQLEELRLNIKKEIDIQFAPQLAAAGFLRRMCLHLRMKQILKRRLAQVVPEIKAKAPPDALYLKK